MTTFCIAFYESYLSTPVNDQASWYPRSSQCQKFLMITGAGVCSDFPCTGAGNVGMALYYPAVRAYSSLQHQVHNSIYSNVLRLQQFIAYCRTPGMYPSRKCYFAVYLKLQATLANNSLMHYDYSRIQHRVITF
jgi:hypothetical protein